MSLASLITTIVLISANPGETPEDLQALLKNIWSPYCKGISLLECPSGQAEKLRDEIRARYFAGETIEVIKKDLAATYGGQLRMLPTKDGREGLAYWLPYVLFVLGIAAVSTIWWRTRKRKVEAPAVPSSAASSVSPEMLEKIESRLKSL